MRVIHTCIQQRSLDFRASKPSSFLAPLLPRGKKGLGFDVSAQPNEMKEQRFISQSAVRLLQLRLHLLRLESLATALLLESQNLLPKFRPCQTQAEVRVDVLLRFSFSSRAVLACSRIFSPIQAMPPIGAVRGAMSRSKNIV